MAIAEQSERTKAILAGRTPPPPKKSNQQIAEQSQHTKDILAKKNKGIAEVTPHAKKVIERHPVEAAEIQQRQIESNIKIASGGIAGLSPHASQVLADNPEAAAAIIEQQVANKKGVATTTPHAKQVLREKADEAAAIIANQVKNRKENKRKIAEVTEHAKTVLREKADEAAAIIEQQEKNKITTNGSQKTGIAEVTEHAKEVLKENVIEAAEIQQRQIKGNIERATGLVAVPENLTAENKEALKKLLKYETRPGFYDVKGYLNDEGGKGIATLREAGFEWGDLSGAAQENLAESEQQRQMATSSTLSLMWQGMTPWDESKGEKASLSGVGIMAAEILVPGVYTARHWEDMSAGEKAFSIAMDIASLIPVGTAMARGARGVQVAGRGARMAGAGKGLLKEAIAQTRAPVDMVIHPIANVKGAARSAVDFAENIAHPSKIPEAVLTTTNGTVRLKVTKDMPASRAMEFRDDLMQLASKGERPVVEIDGQVVWLGQSPFMKEVGGGVVHATQQGKKYTNGLVVTEKFDKSGKLMPLSEQGLFVANEPLPRFATGASAFGMTGDQPTLLIFSKDMAKEAISSGKIYKSPWGEVSEMEMKFPVGTKLPPPKQILFTRVGPLNQKVQIYLYEPLSKAQRLKLKGIALIEDLRTPFKPAISVKGASSKGAAEDAVNMVTDTDLDKIVKTLKEAGNVEQARTLSTARKIIRTQRVMPGTVDDFVSGARAKTTEIERTSTKGAGSEKGKTIDETRAGETSEAETRATEPRDDEPRTTEPRDEEPRTTEPRDDEPRTTEPRKPEPRVPEPRDDEPRTTEPRKPEPRVPERRDDEPRREEPKPEEPRRDEPRVGETPQRVPRRKKKQDEEDESPKPRIGGNGKDTTERFQAPKGSVTHAQGIGWWTYYPPYSQNDRKFTREKPEGAKVVESATKAMETIQRMGGKVNLEDHYDMGIMDVHIEDAPLRPSGEKGKKAISFTRDTDKTYGKLQRKALKKKPPVNKGSGKRVGPYHYKNGRVSRNPIR